MTTKECSIQNIYDNQEFFEKYKKLRTNDQGFNNQIEQPALISLVPNLNEKVILDIGCGFGNFCSFAVSQRACEVVGIDPSKNMISEAKKVNFHENIIYNCIPIEKAEFEEKQFDIIVSSLALHYVNDYYSIIKNISKWIKLGGYFIFSVEHPICTSNPNAKLGKDENGLEFHPIYNYRDEKLFTQKWFVDGVKKYHRTVSTYINTLIENKFNICSILEPAPTDELIDIRLDFKIHKIRPPLLIIKSKKY